jgi:hypothetical protein
MTNTTSLNSIARTLWALLGLASLALTRPAIADAPPGRYSFPTDGVVLDNRTKLTWQRKLEGMYTQPDAATYCANLKLAQGGWRLPTRAELLTIVDPTRYSPAVDATAFPDIPMDAKCWTSSGYVFNPKFHWAVVFTAGDAGPNESTVPIYVRCVR